MSCKTYSTFPRGIEREVFNAFLDLYYHSGKTYSTFPRGIESESRLRPYRRASQVRPIRHSHGELKAEWVESACHRSNP